MNQMKQTQKLNLRQRAEAILDDPTIAVNKVSFKNMKHLIHEFYVHQIELEMQNETLRQTQAELEESRDKYTNLYDFAPIGYFTLETTGMILEVNLTGANLLGVPRSKLLNQSFSLFINEADLEKFYSHYHQVCETKVQQSCELTLVRETGQTFIAHLESIAIVEKGTEAINHWRIVMIDITQRKQTEIALRDSEERYALMMRGANDGLWDWNLNTNLIYFSPRWKSMLGYQDADIGNSPDDWFKWVHPDDIMGLKATLEAHIANYTPHFEYEYRLRHQDKGYRWILCRGAATRDAKKGVYRLAGSQTDITHRKEAEQKLYNQATHDMLTGLPNRILLMRDLENSIRVAQKHANREFAVLFLDLDRFKLINDGLGHLMGDKLLMIVADRLKECLRSSDTIARLGGDEFIILLNDIKTVENVTQIADLIQQTVAKPINLGGHTLVITVSIGITMSQCAPTDQAKDFLRDADTAMYQAKAQGPARFKIFDSCK